MKPSDLPKKLTPTSIKKLPVLPRRYDVKDHLQRRLYMTVYPSGLKNWHYRYRMKGDRDAKRYIIGEATPDQARKIAEKIAGKVANGINPNAEKAALRKQQQKARESTLRAFIDGRYGEWVISERKSGGATVKAIKSTFDFLLDKPMDSINTWELEKWRKTRHAAGITPTTTNRHIAGLRACLSKAVAWGVIDSHPLKDLKQSRVDRNQTIRTIDDEQEQRLRDALKARDRKMRKERMSANSWREDRDYATKPDFGKHVDHLEPIVLLALNTGMRRGELLQIKWTDVKTDKIIVRGQTTKSSQTREIPLNKEAKMILKDWRSDSEYVFNNGDNPLTTIKKSWAAIKTAAGLPDLRFHDLRHTFATRVLRRGGDIKTVSALLGHADIATTARYLHATEESMRKAVELL